MRASIPWLRLAALIAASIAVLALIHAPSPTLFGGLVGSLIYALAARQELSLPPWAFTVGQAIVGISIGGMVDLPTLRGLGAHWVIVLAVTLGTLVLSVAAGQVLRLHKGVSAVTGSFAMVAGGASGMTALAHDLGADDRVVTVVQYFRVLVVLLAMPAIVAIVFQPGSHSAVALAIDTPSGPMSLLFVVVALPLGLLLGRVLHLPAPAILGCLVAGLGLALLPSFGHVQVPTPILAVGYALVGIQVGLKFTLESLRSISRMLPTAFVLIAVVIAGSAGMGVVLANVAGVSQLDGYLATTPGGLYAVLATAADTGSNVTFVTGVQLVRLLVVLFSAPLLARLLPHDSQT